jgi:hypothetical protein
MALQSVLLNSQEESPARTRRREVFVRSGTFKKLEKRSGKKEKAILRGN